MGKTLYFVLEKASLAFRTYSRRGLEEKKQDFYKRETERPLKFGSVRGVDRTRQKEICDMAGQSGAGIKF